MNCSNRLQYQAAHASQNYRELVDLARAHATPLASHDDTTLEHVEQAIRDRVAIAEFPTTLEAAEALHAAGIRVLMGAPNLVRGGSHAGNIATADLAEAGVLDILSPDYVPSSLLMAALCLSKRVASIGLPVAIRTVTKTPDDAVGLGDRGEIGGIREDLVRVRPPGRFPAVRSVWRDDGGQGEPPDRSPLLRLGKIGPGRLVVVVGPAAPARILLLSVARPLPRDVVFPAGQSLSELRVGARHLSAAFDESVTECLCLLVECVRFQIRDPDDIDIRAGRTVVCTFPDCARLAPRAMRRSVVLVTAPADAAVRPRAGTE